MKELKHEPDLLATQLRQTVLVESRDVDAIDRPRIPKSGVQSRDQTEQRRFAAARWTDDGQKRRARNLERERMQDGERRRCRS